MNFKHKYHQISSNIYSPNKFTTSSHFTFKLYVHCAKNYMFIVPTKMDIYNKNLIKKFMFNLIVYWNLVRKCNWEINL